MKKGKDQIIFLLVLALTIVFLLSTNLVSAETNSCDPTIKLVSQDPNPAIPNDYIKIVFEITDLSFCDGFSVKLNPEYPFSLDSNDSLIQTIESIPFTPDGRNVWMVSYKLRIDSAAFDGDYNLKLQYHDGSSQNFISYAENSFNVSIQDSRTQFDAVIQETSGSQVSIAIANIGKYAANSVVVRIPEQDDFTTTGTDGQMVGNLESGDYTLVGFTISPKMTFSQNMTRPTTKNPAIQNISQQNTILKFDVYYTDNLGKRRIENMTLPLKMASNSSTSLGGFSRTSSANKTSLFSKWYSWVIIVALLILIYYFYRNPDKLKDLLEKLKPGKAKKASSYEIPDWVKNSKVKNK